MIQVASFTFNPFQENTYVLHDDTKACIIIDPGCYTQLEKDQLVQHIEQNDLKPVRLINTHCHIDHVFGNKFIAEKYDLTLEIHEGEVPVLNMLLPTANMYGVPVEPSPAAGNYLKEGDFLTFGESQMKILFTPGHSPASISFYSEADKFVIAGDVLFRGSIGRTDLMGGDFDTLIKSIKTQLFPLGDDVVVYSGHGPETTIGYEKANNPFLT